MKAVQGTPGTHTLKQQYEAIHSRPRIWKSEREETFNNEQLMSYLSNKVDNGELIQYYGLI